MQPYKLAIVGLGPKGLYALEHLLARLQHSDEDKEIEIHLFEKTGVFGAGEIYHPDQPDYLLMNYPNRNINAWSGEKPKPAVPKALSFVKWLYKYKNRPTENLEDEFASRKTVGEYLMYCFGQLVSFQNKSVTIAKHTATVIDIERIGQGLELTFNDNGGRNVLRVQQVLLTTGHSSCRKSTKYGYDDSSSTSKSNFVPYVYPVQKKLCKIDEHATIGIKGLGLTFIDTVLAITEGRGGKFINTNSESLMYVPSGNEPRKIYAFSRSGLPMIPRNGTEGKMYYLPKYFTYDNIRNRAGISKKINFNEHILPLYIAEVQYRYYSILFHQHNLNFYPYEKISQLNKQVDSFHERYPDAYRLDCRDLFKPKSFDAEQSELDALAYMRYTLKEARIGSASSAFMAAAMTWGRLSDTFNTFYSFGKMTADSQSVFDHKYRSQLNRISYGPPVENMAKIIALVETGLVDLNYAKNPEVKEVGNRWKLSNSHTNPVEVDILIDARIPTFRSPDDWSPLLKNMQDNGLVRPFRNNDTSTYEVGCPEINRQGKAIGKNGSVVHQIGIYGTPTEGMVYDNDSLSRTRNNFASRWSANVLENSWAMEYN
ncbi:MAG: FAD/NAD(P)-binding protein [Pricia sp.]|nr:FAD/NAD(P)-binding protein [Pricia sp.]